MQDESPHLTWRFKNDTTTTICVFLEPWGADYWVLPGQAFEFTAADGSDMTVDCIHHDQGVSVFIGDASEVAVVDEAGAQLECGYQRPEGQFGA